MRNNQQEEIGKIRDEVTLLKTLLSDLKPELEKKAKSLEEKLILLPNLPHISVPIGPTPEENDLVREGGIKPVLYEGAKPHWDLAKKYDLINFELGNKL